MQNEITFEAGGYRCVAVRSDRSWGHGLKVNVHSNDGLLLKVVTFACHPEFSSFEILQAMNTQHLVELAASRLNSGELEDSLLQAQAANLQLLFGFEVLPK
jgi:hypothetical protein